VFHIYVACFNNLWRIISFLEANSKIRKQLETERKANKEEQRKLQTRNQELQKELEAVKVTVA
jgi:uncharacterized protein YgiM (DUF1202 family)